MSRKTIRVQRPVFISLEAPDHVLKALSQLQKPFPMTVEGMPNSNPANAAALLLSIALANVEIIAPRILSMVRYCKAEGIDQYDYLKSLIETQFKKKLRLATNRAA